MPDRSYLAWPFFDERHRALKDELEDFAASLGALADDDHDADATCRALVRRLGDAGLLRLSGELDVRSLCLAREALAYRGGLPDFAFAMQGLGSGAVSLFGTDAQRELLLPRVVAGEAIPAFALSEADAGSDVAALAMSARADRDGYVLDGSKTWISNGTIADAYVVFARTGEAPGARGLSAFLLDADTPGLEVSERIEVIAPHPLATLVFDGVRVGRDRVIGAPGEGFKVAMATLDVFRPTVGAAALGFARRAFDETLEHVRARELFGAPRITREAAMAKLHATEAAQRIVDAAVQLHGGLGVTSGHPVERLYREVRALRIYEGASEVQQVIIARQALAAHAAEQEARR